MFQFSQELSADVAVIGGGSAGLAAAITAARRGQSVVLVEQFGFCGGMSVTSLVHSMDGVVAQHDLSRLAVGGFAVELLHRLGTNGGWGCADNPPEAFSFLPEVLKLTADQLLRESGVRCLFHTRLVDLECESGRIVAAVLHSKAGFWQLRADYFIDASGDGDLCALGGAPFEISESPQPMTLHFKITHLTGKRTWRELEVACHAVLQAAYERGEGPRFGGPWIIRERAGEISLNCTRLYGNSLSPEDLTRAEMEGRTNAWKVWRLWQTELPDFRDSQLEATAPAVGVRESRRIVGDYQINAEDLRVQRAFPDVIGLGAWPFDIHPANGAVGYHPHKENPPPPYPIPFRCLLPQKIENALVAGRCASATHEAHGSTRVQGTALMMGEAAGTACAVARQHRSSLRDLPISELQNALRQTGTILDPNDLPLRPTEWPQFA